jgi:hypothetical protein
MAATNATEEPAHAAAAAAVPMTPTALFAPEATVAAMSVLSDDLLAENQSLAEWPVFRHQPISRFVSLLLYLLKLFFAMVSSFPSGMGLVES